MKYIIKKQSFLSERKFTKTYEENTNDPQIGDYVICDEQSPGASFKTIQFISNNIGQFVEYNVGRGNSSRYPFLIYYENAPIDLAFTNKMQEMNRKEIIHFSKNREDLEIYIDSKKYNL